MTKQRFIIRAAVARLWLVARALRERTLPDPITQQTLARDLEVCTKTIARDIECLRDRFRHDIDFNFERGWFYRSLPLRTYL